MLDQHQRHFAGKRRDDIEDLFALGFRYARGGLIEQQNFRLGRDRNGDFEQALLAVGKRADARMHDIGERQPLQEIGRRANDGSIGADRAQKARRQSLAPGRSPARSSRAA